MSKVNAIVHWHHPTNLEELQIFLGLVEFYPKFIRDYAKVSVLMTDQLKAHAIVDPTKPFVVENDASDRAIGAVLLQDGRPVAFESKKLDKAQHDYSVYEQELYAIIHTLKKWWHYLYGAQFEIVFDHESIKWFTQQTDLKGRKARWAEILQEYDAPLRYCKGRYNVVADALSCMPEISSLAFTELTSDFLQSLRGLYEHDKVAERFKAGGVLHPLEIPDDFLDNLEMAFLVSGRDDEATKLRAFPLVLREGAKAWYQTLAPEERRDWETLKTAFIKKFRHQEPLEEIWRQLLELRQTSPNDYRSYEGKFSNLWEKWCASLGEGERAPECLKKDCFLAGLYPILREKVKVKFPDTFEKAMAYAKEKDRKLKFQAQLQGGTEPPPPAQPIARTVAGTSVTDQESSQQELLQQITNQLESLSINLVQGVSAPQSGNDRNHQEGQRQTREYVCYNCGEVGHGMYFFPHPQHYQGNGNHRQAPRQQVTPPRARPPNGQQNAPVAPPVQILRPLPPPPQTPTEIPPLPSG
ncbi:hypothetical protein L7F22_014950 [Adiantum nelumboides]|nr:hypothetical protein [Adiantum nelumboides]